MTVERPDLAPTPADHDPDDDVIADLAQAIRDANASSEATEWWTTNPHLIPAHLYAAAVFDRCNERALQTGIHRARMDAVNAALRRAGIEYPLGAAGVDDLAAQRDGALAELDEAGPKAEHVNTLQTLLEHAQDATRDAIIAACTAHHEHTAAVTNWRSRIGEAADILDIAGHHEAAALMRKHASIPAKPRRSVYADNSLPVPLEDRHRDALSAIALMDGRVTDAEVAIAFARAAIGLDTPQETS